MSALFAVLLFGACPQPSHCTIIGRSCIPGSPFGTCCDGGFCTRHLPPPHTDFQCALTTTTTTTTSIPASTTTSTAGTTSSTTTTMSTTSTTTVSTSTTTTTTSGGTTTTGAFVTDNFERASLGGNWNPDSIGDGTTLIIVGSSDLSCSPSDGVCNGGYTAFTPQVDNQYACAQFSGSGNGETGVCLGGNGTTSQACCVAFNDGVPADDYWALTTFPPQVYVETQATPIFATGDYIGILRTTATTWQCYRSTNGTTWTALGSSHVVGTLSNPGQPGAQADNNGPSPTPFMLEVWEAGNGGLPTARACGTP